MRTAHLIPVSLHLFVTLHSLACPLLDVVSRIRSPRGAHLLLSHRALDFFDINQLLYPHDLTSDGLCYGVVDGRHAFAEAERFEYTLRLLRHANAGAHECYPEIRHCGYVTWRISAFERFRRVCERG